MTPSEVLAESPRMQVTMLRYLRWRGVQARQAYEDARRR